MLMMGIYLRMAQLYGVDIYLFIISCTFSPGVSTSIKIFSILFTNLDLCLFFSSSNNTLRFFLTSALVSFGPVLYSSINRKLNKDLFTWK